MGRVERFREARRIRKKYTLLIFLLLVLLLVGVLVTDYSTNNLLKNKKNIEVLYIKYIDINCYELYIMNKKIILNTSYINRDYQYMKKYMNSIFNKSGN